MKIYFRILSDQMSNVVFKEFNSCIFKSRYVFFLDLTFPFSGNRDVSHKVTNWVS